MIDKITSVQDDYIQPPETKTFSMEPADEEPEIQIDEEKYGVNKPYRITIKAKVSHGKNKSRKAK